MFKFTVRGGLSKRLQASLTIKPHAFLAIVVPMLLATGFLLPSHIILTIFRVMPLLAVEYMLGNKHIKFLSSTS